MVIFYVEDWSVKGYGFLCSGNWLCGFGLNTQYQFQTQTERSLKGELGLWCLAVLPCGEKEGEGSD